MELKPSVFAAAVTCLCVGWALRSALSKCGFGYAKSIHTQLAQIMGTQTELAAELAAITPQITAIGDGITALNTRITDLEDAIANSGLVTPEVQAAVDALKAEVVATAAKLPLTPVIEDPPLPPAP